MVSHGAFGGVGEMFGASKEMALVSVVRWKFCPPPQLISRLLGLLRSQCSSNPCVIRVPSGRAVLVVERAKSPDAVKMLPPPVQRQSSVLLASLMNGAE